MPEENKPPECPDWCTSEHRPGEYMSFHWGPRTAVHPKGTGDPDRVSVTPFHATGSSLPDLPEVNLCSTVGDECTHLGMTPRGARIIAEIIDTLSRATPGQQREYAEGIRASAQSVEMETGPRGLAAQTGEPEAGA